MLMNGQLAGAVFAPLGTMAYVVLMEMQRINVRRQGSNWISLDFSPCDLDRLPAVGLVLEPDLQSCGYSLPECRDARLGAVVAFIGERLPENQISIVAQKLLKLLKPSFVCGEVAL